MWILTVDLLQVTVLLADSLAGCVIDCKWVMFSVIPILTLSRSDFAYPADSMILFRSLSTLLIQSGCERIVISSDTDV